MTDPTRSLGRVVMVVPTYNEAAEPRVDRRAGCAAPSRRSTCSSSTTARPTAPARSPTGSPRPTPRSGCSTAPRRPAWARRTCTASGVALDAGYDVIGEMDADGSHQPEQLHRLLTALEDADLVIGSRWVPGGSVVNWPLRREALSRGGNLYVRVLLGMKVRDATAGYRLFRRSHAGEDRPRDRAVHRLRLPDRHGLPHPAGRAARRRGAHRVHRAGARRLQDVRCGGPGVPAAHHRLGAAASASSRYAARSGGRAGSGDDRAAGAPGSPGGSCSSPSWSCPCSRSTC